MERRRVFRWRITVQRSLKKVSEVVVVRACEKQVHGKGLQASEFIYKNEKSWNSMKDW
jgi:hypothetical protein